MNEDRKVSEFSEYDLLERFRDRIGPVSEGELWSGDDTALVAAGSDHVLFTTDTMVEGVDFDLSYCDPQDVGFKAVAINVSDIAAMGGRPGAAVATLALPPETPLDAADGLLEGMLEASARWSVRIVGGDLSRADAISLGIALIGTPPASGPVRRQGARVGDSIGVTGTPGLSGIGLGRLRREGRAARESASARKHLRPDARVEEAALLAEVGVTAMIDVSDGLAIDLYRLCRASGIGCDITTDDLTAILAEVEPGLDDAKGAVLLGGEDFELLFAIDGEKVDRAHALLAAIDTECRWLGYARDTGMMVDGESLESWKDRSWDHLLNR